MSRRLPSKRSNRCRSPKTESSYCGASILGASYSVSTITSAETRPAREAAFLNPVDSIATNSVRTDRTADRDRRNIHARCSDRPRQCRRRRVSGGGVPPRTTAVEGGVSTRPRRVSGLRSDDVQNGHVSRAYSANERNSADEFLRAVSGSLRTL